MKSVGQAKRQLPNKFVEQLYDYFPPLLADQILLGYTSQRCPTLRVNTLKADIREIMDELKENNIKFDRVLWYQDALIIKNATEQQLCNLTAYKQGKIYLQSLSSMLPPLILKPKAENIVLDLAAAPGGKTSQMAAMMNNKGKIIAVEINQIRYQRLQYNLNKQGVRNVKTFCADGSRFGKIYPNSFDKVLVDAPCSGEGLFLLTDRSSYRSWHQKLITNSLKIQRRLLISAVLAAKPGGQILYSTCTINPAENESIIDQVLAKFPGQLELTKIKLQIPGSLPGLTTVNNTELHPTLANSLRIIPSQNYEGFYCCLLTKLSATN